ncbi:flagellar export chaperone FlgN [Pantoea sp. B65]|uniref:flagellar export chaperone FlgN n=1 Tax=Pantoea sp. B65 TaxID=2813359 RepID=UPI0039B4B764
MNSNTGRVKQLLADIKQDLQHYDSLQILLQLQHEKIIACDSNGSEEVRQRLMSLYQQLHLSAQRRHSLLCALNLSPDSEGLKKILPCLPERVAAQVATCWSTLESRALHCQQINQRNGLLLSMQQETLQQLIRPEPATMFYQG